MSLARSITYLLIVAGAASYTARARAQSGPDVRSVKPIMLLAVDSSGSMERTLDCNCTTASCSECMPNCGAMMPERNRWATVVEALSGSMQGFSCAAEERTGAAYTGKYDYAYFLPHNRITYTSQTSNGVLDSYIDRLRFGLMTFDGIGTLKSANPLIEMHAYSDAAFLSRSQGEEGMYSYGDIKQFYIPGCPSTYAINNGAQSAASPVGGLISVGASDSDPRTVNSQIQQSLFTVRPYGATPIAGMLDDIRYYFNNDQDVVAANGSVGDPYHACRPRYVLLLTDGYPNQDMREEPYNCEQPGSTCPYDKPEEIAADLCQYDTGSSQCSGMVDGVFVVGFAVNDAASATRLNDIAALGGTGQALLASDLGTLTTKLSQVFDEAVPAATTRTVPAFSSDNSGSVSRFTTGFKVGNSVSPWSGILERTRYECDENLQPVEQAISDAANDRFHVVLNNRATPRRLYTIVPSQPSSLGRSLSGTAVSESMLSLPLSHVRELGTEMGAGGPSCSYSDGSLTDRTAVNNPVETALALEEFSSTNSRLTTAMLNVADNTERQELISWVHGDPGSAREAARLGDIQRSSPIVVSAPSEDIPDESYNLFRQLPAVANRPKVLYVVSNDGILHAFVAENSQITAGPHLGMNLASGEELWGFIPPEYLSKLKHLPSSHQSGFDGRIHVRDVFFNRAPGASPTGSQYHTVLIVDGVDTMYALDVTDPLLPKFLWQSEVGDAAELLGRAAIAQVLIQDGGQLQERAVALLPGGRNASLIGENASCTSAGCTPTGMGAAPTTESTTGSRTTLGCWPRQGRQLTVLDIATGEVLKYIDDRIFNAPLSGGVSVFTGDLGTIATRAFVSDEDGVVWRLDMSSPDVTDWRAAPFHDTFWNAGATAGQPGHYPPVVSTDNQGRVVVIQATGDLDELDGSASNRVVSLTEKLSFNDTGEVTEVKAALNWEVPLLASEQVTGPLELFNGKVYFASFRSASNPNDLCQFGESRLWGVDYLNSEDDSQLPRPALESVEGSGNHDVRFVGPYTNQIIMGVNVVQRPTCFAGREEIDPYIGRRYVVEQTGGGSYHLVGQVSGGTGGGAGGPSIGVVDRELPRPESYTRVLSWASDVEM